MAHILVVDDRAANRQLLVTVLGYYGHTVTEAANGALALEQIKAAPPELVITDLLMPNMDGEELCRRLRAEPLTADLPIVIHTASYRTRQARQIADRVGVRWVLPKPSSPAQIVSVVAEALGVESVQPMEQVAVAENSAGIAARRAPAGHGWASLQERNRRLTELLEDAVRIAENQAETLAAADLGHDMHSLASRLTSLVNLGLQMSWERDPNALIELFCAAAQDVLSARYVGVVILAPDESVRKFASRGLDGSMHDAVSAAIGGCAAAQKVLGDRGQARMIVAARSGDFTGLPQPHPPVRTLLAGPCIARESVCGWMYAADRLGGEAFSADDERLMMALGAQLATVWSGLMVLDDLDRRVAERTRQLESANSELQAFSSLVSHDLRAPLGIIDGFAKALGHKFGHILPADANRYLAKIERNVQIMGTLINDLLHFAKTSRAGMNLRQVELSRLVQDCLREFGDEIRRRNVTVSIDTLPSCHADPALVTQVLLNLIGNALKYTRKHAQPVIEIGSRMVNEERVIFVRDNGAGFDMKEAQGLFTPFFRLHSATEFEGSGFGLALVKQIIERHGGRVWADAQPGQGASFLFTLPTHPVAVA
ncbi:MAG TPA: ATP-binding protein [Ramlibacter sp.]|nr:ATP-binding protein [Ramlibacter sp.]